MGNPNLIVSYVPGLYDENVESAEEIEKVTQDMGRFRIQNVQWVSSNNTVQPVFCIDAAHEILAHMKWWGKPKTLDQVFFLFIYPLEGGQYSIGITPNLHEAHERALAKFSTPPNEYTIFAMPLVFISAQNAMGGEICRSFSAAKTTPIGIADANGKIVETFELPVLYMADAIENDYHYAMLHALIGRTPDVSQRVLN